jgi:hypothetical protein
LCEIAQCSLKALALSMDLRSGGHRHYGTAWGVRFTHGTDRLVIGAYLLIQIFRVIATNNLRKNPRFARLIESRGALRSCETLAPESPKQNVSVTSAIFDTAVITGFGPETTSVGDLPAGIPAGARELISGEVTTRIVPSAESAKGRAKSVADVREEN